MGDAFLIQNIKQDDTPSIVTDRLLLYLDAANSSSYPGSGTTWFDLSGNNYNATIIGTNPYQTTEGGQMNYVPLGGQTNSWIRLPHSALQQVGNQYTVLFWMKPFSSDTRYFHSVANSGNDNLQIVQLTDQQIRTWFNGITSDPISAPNNQWLQLSLVKTTTTSNSGVLYKNNLAGVTSTTSFGNSLNQVDTNGWVLNQEQDSVGGGFDSSQNALASWSVVMLYNKQLSSEEIEKNYNFFKNRYGL